MKTLKTEIACHIILNQWQDKESLVFNDIKHHAHHRQSFNL